MKPTEAEPVGEMNTWVAGTRLARMRFGRYLVGGSMWAATHAIPVVAGLVLKAVFDHIGTPSGTAATALVLLGVYVAVEALRNVTFWLAMVLWPGWWRWVATVMRANLLDSIVRAPGSASTRLPASTGEAIGRFRDDIEDVVWFVDVWVDVAGGVVFTTTALAVMLTISPLITLVVVLPLVAVVIGTRLLSHRIRAAHRALRVSGASVTAFIGDVFGGALALKAASAEDRALARFSALHATRRRSALRAQIIGDLLPALSETSADLTTGLVLLLAAPAMRTGQFTVGDLALFTSYAGWLTRMPRWIGQMLARHRAAGVSLERLAEMDATQSIEGVLADRPAYITAPMPPTPPAPARSPSDALTRLDVRDLTVVHPSTGRGVNRVDVSVRAGELTVITGAVAAGKTTLLRGVLGLMPARSGHIRWNGRDIDDPGTELVPPRCAYVSQVPRLFSASLAENVRLGCDVTATDLLTSLAVAQFDVMALPHGLDTMVGAHGSQLSGGQAQRATIARAVVRRPDLLVLDDVSSALDFRTETALWEALDEAASTCLVVSHRTAALERAGHIVVLDRGNVAGAGSFDDLLGGCAEFRRLLDAGRDERSEGVA